MAVRTAIAVSLDKTCVRLARRLRPRIGVNNTRDNVGFHTPTGVRETKLEVVRGNTAWRHLHTCSECYWYVRTLNSVT